MSKPKPSPTLNPWEALFSSATRPQAAHHDDGTSHGTPAKASSNTIPPASAGGYTILMQHSMTPKYQRQWALSSTITMSTEQSRSKGSIASSMASMTLKSSTRRAFQGSWCGMSGPFLVRQAFEELSHRCNGAVVFVSLLGTSGVMDLDELNDSSFYENNDQDDSIDDDENNDLQAADKRRTALQMFRRHGAWVDLSSDPYGWEDGTEEEDGRDSFVHKSAMDKLQSIATAIGHAAASIENRRPPIEGLDKNQKKQHQMKQPVPIVFETLSPLLSEHGVERVRVLIKSLGRALSSSTIAPSGKNTTILSPIIAPILYESLRPSEHRSLEDMSDAMVHLNFIVTPDNSTPIVMNGPNSMPVISGVMDLVRQGGRGGGGLGGKLIHNCVPFHVFRSASNSSLHPMDTRGSCYWSLDHNGSGVVEDPVKEQQVRNKSGSAIQISEGAQASSETTSRPRIFLEDNDPEFVDYDEEEDLDDDLDL